ncbi:ATP-dependent Clp protease ATP-binding subunit [Prevotella sp. AM42-24]|jgi:ATP-dependent Clp protease ATP-binding subunit ClpC|uniref:ATP-dependent Clp protease ATP-binding subunit n=1 Tax=Prevotella sp. AM42-24 TaxID=2293125 RepID=UPI000E4DAA48|nr:ATP-dependent Clp protease ATP-binding subunit [Prevotella sp. AM42-24]RGH46646.1 ATP-dependent Clp protease ATP-binding subunit [Prevotella sp. AM42-24]
MEIQKSIKRITILDGFSFPSDDEDDFFLNGNEPDKDSSASSKTASNTVTGQMHNNKTPFLDKYSTDLTKAAKDGKLDPVVGREHEIQRVLEIIGRRKKNNPILIGEPGVGKSAIVEGLAQLIVKQQTSPALFNKRIVSVDLTAMVAGSKYRGQFEERIKGLITELENNPDIIIFIDEIHTLIGAGGGSGTMDAANILKPALARGTVQCIGATTFKEYANSIEKDGALERRFQKVIVEPTTTEQTLAILRNIKDRYEEHHGVTFSDEALEACVKLTERYVTDRFFPDKAIDVMDEVGSKLRLANIKVPDYILDLQNEIEEVAAKKLEAVGNQNFELAASYRDKGLSLEKKLDLMHKKWQSGDCTERIPVTESDVADVVSKMSGVPVQRMAEEEGVRLKNMSVVLKKSVIAQDDAIEKMVKAIQRNRIGLRDPNHPIGAFMFLGPTGVGKTYLAKKLAEELFGSKDALIRVDMSEYSESFNTSRLLGAPPGYVGYDEGGQLTERVRRKPYSIVLLDEIEKAHDKVYNMLLQVLDEGRLTDGNGRLIDFRNTVIIMTSNAGTRQLKEFGSGIGFNAGGLTKSVMDEKDKEYARSIIQKSLSKQFSPEFLNRLDEIITFNQLDIDAIKRIIDIELRGLFGRVHDMGYEIQITDKAKELVATKGYDVQFGARPLKRAIQTYIEDGVCELLLGGKLKKGDTISIGKNPNREELTFKVAVVE